MLELDIILDLTYENEMLSGRVRELERKLSRLEAQSIRITTVPYMDENSKVTGIISSSSATN